MDKDEWLDVCRENWSDFVALIERFHPSKTRIDPSQMTLDELFDPGLTITAPNAEKACAALRKQIAEETAGQPVISQATVALESGDIATLNTIFNQVWFGAPESRSIMAVPGFSIMCDLLSDLPEPE